jgi:hypothetical protein
MWRILWRLILPFRCSQDGNREYRTFVAFVGLDKIVWTHPSSDDLICIDVVERVGIAMPSILSSHETFSEDSRISLVSCHMRRLDEGGGHLTLFQTAILINDLLIHPVSQNILIYVGKVQCPSSQINSIDPKGWRLLDEVCNALIFREDADEDGLHVVWNLLKRHREASYDVVDVVVLKGNDVTSHVPLSMLATICPHHVDATKGSIDGDNVLFDVSEGLEIHVVASSPLARDVQVGASVNADEGFLWHSTVIEVVDAALANACFDLTANTFIWNVQTKPL